MSIFKAAILQSFYFNNMKEVITISSLDDLVITIFTKHITYIEHAAKGCVIHVNSGGENVAIETSFKWAEMVNFLALK